MFSNANNTKTHIGDEIDVVSHPDVRRWQSRPAGCVYGTIFSWWLFDQHLEPTGQSALGLYVIVDELLRKKR